MNSYMWDKAMGGLVKKLEGPKEGLLDLKWHPKRPIIVSLSGFGTIFIWSVSYVQNFSAFAPCMVFIILCLRERVKCSHDKDSLYGGGGECRVPGAGG
jgi:WD40 repeat protein